MMTSEPPILKSASDKPRTKSCSMCSFLRMRITVSHQQRGAFRSSMYDVSFHLKIHRWTSCIGKRMRRCSKYVLSHSFFSFVSTAVYKRMGESLFFVLSGK
uniref:Uncharacterized protein n=1 Tax=Wuchereria bancrofti TaxID=6293 RepID=A0AAF5RTD6_WUCBA